MKDASGLEVDRGIIDAVDAGAGTVSPIGMVGHNRPPIREVLAERNEELVEFLAFEGADLISRRDELMAASGRVPASIEDSDTAQKVADFTKQLAACIKAAETRRVGDKEPALQAGRVIDGWYKRVTEPLEKAKREVESRLTAWQRKQAEIERRRREEVERTAREAAETARRDALAAEQAARDAKTLEQAIEAERLAKQAEADATRAAQQAAVKPAELHRDTGDYGAVASLRRYWDFRDLSRADLDLETLRPFLPQDALEKAVRAYIKSGGRELRGTVIFENTTTQVR